tara:strand:- start:211 stop:1176 length:966 start_codon:yes stop_codon:yes gene_type:complete
MRIAFFTESPFNGKVPRGDKNLRTDLAWMCSLDVDHYSLLRPLDSIEKKYDIGIFIVPKTHPEIVSRMPIVESMRRVCKKIGIMQEGPHWYFQDYPMEQQVWFYNTLVQMDFLLCHNEMDVKYFKGLTHKPCYKMNALMLEDNIESHIVNSDARDGVIIGGNMCRWYGGFDSYIVAQQFGESVYVPTMGRKVDNEEKLENLNHLPYMNWLDWINNLSRFRYAVHLMPTQAAGTFALNCAYHGIPCIGYKGLDTQELCFPDLTVEMGDLDKATELTQRLKMDKDFYNNCSKISKTIYKSIFSEKEYIYTMKQVIGEILNETN